MPACIFLVKSVKEHWDKVEKKQVSGLIMQIIQLGTNKKVIRIAWNYPFFFYFPSYIVGKFSAWNGWKSTDKFKCLADFRQWNFWNSAIAAIMLVFQQYNFVKKIATTLSRVKRLERYIYLWYWLFFRENLKKSAVCILSSQTEWFGTTFKYCLIWKKS